MLTYISSVHVTSNIEYSKSFPLAFQRNLNLGIDWSLNRQIVASII